ncbi:diguanylate cyclase [bacterium]|nr:diguanylate cyclase [bacterium]
MLKHVIEALSEVGPQARLSDVSKAIVDVCLATLDTSLVSLFTIDPFVGGIEYEASEGISSSVQNAFIKLAGGLVTERDNRDPWTLDVDRNILDDNVQVIRDSGIRSIIACPIRSAAGASGALVAYYGRNAAPPHAIHLIQAIAAQASAMISYAHEIEQASIFRDGLAGANKELTTQAAVDGLTGLANHRTFQQTLQDLCTSPVGRPLRTFSLIMLDVDHFKMYNDTYGHQEGDRVLRTVADVLATTLRQGDTAARYGGEEFTLILRDADKHEALAVANRIRHAISTQENNKRKITVSMGIAECPIDDTTPSAIIEKADRALYHAKITGRNRVVLWGSTEYNSESIDENPCINVQSEAKTVLVVANDRNANHISKALSRTQCQIDIAEDSAKAAELLKTTGFDIALVALSSLPGADVKSLSDITAIHPHMPVVLITNSHLLEESREALHRGASDVLIEPYNASELPMLIERNLERCRLERQRMSEHGTSLMLQAIDSLVAAIDARDHCTAGHSHRVTTLSLAIADELNMPTDDRAALELSARLHDIGKLGVPDNALNKRTKLTEAEWELMYQHPVLGSKIVGTIDELAYVSTIIRHHHERLDGTGYPDGLQGPAIPYPARVIAVADAYEAMTTKRAHRKCRTPREAFIELQNHVGTYYNEEIVDALGRRLICSGELTAIPERKAA